MIVFLVNAVDWRSAIVVFRQGISPLYLFSFLLMALGVVVAYAVRWHLLLDGNIKLSQSVVAAVLSLGGNMFLPVRGGDLLRVQFSHAVTGMSHAEVFASLVVEKIIDLVTIAGVGLVASIFLRQDQRVTHLTLLMLVAVSALALAFVAILMIQQLGPRANGWLRPVFKYLGKGEAIETHIAHLISDAREKLTLAGVSLPGILTMAMWLSVYALSYIIAAHFVGVTLTYPESLLVLFAGALGLMIPAAPSGLGTFHASVVSAFIIMDRSAAEGLLVATAIHLLFFVAYVLPAAVIYGRWRLKRVVPIPVK
jgi:uncharacterized protein (TIRG00374 family)